MWRGEPGHEVCNPYNTGHMCLLERKCLLLSSQQGTCLSLLATGHRSLRIVYDLPTTSEGRLPDIVDAQKKRQ
jgi:hypothetical protein